MKKQRLVLLMTCLLIGMTAISATDNSTYQFKHQQTLAGCDINGVTSGNTSTFIQGIKFKVFNTLANGDKVIALLSWKEKAPVAPTMSTTTKKALKLSYVSKNQTLVYDITKAPTLDDKISPNFRFIKHPDNSTLRYYLLPADSFNLVCDTTNLDKMVKFSYLNVSSLPGKLRFGHKDSLTYPNNGGKYLRKFDVSSGINIGYSAGIRIGLDRQKTNTYFLSFLGGFNVSTISVDSATTDGKASTSSQTVAAITPTLGALFEVGQFQLGFFTGIDFLTGTGDIARYWQYRNKPWLGIGIGVSIFGKGQSNTQTQNQ